MQNNFDLKKYLVENKLTPASQMNEDEISEADWQFVYDWAQAFAPEWAISQGITNPLGAKQAFQKKGKYDMLIAMDKLVKDKKFSEYPKVKKMFGLEENDITNEYFSFDDKSPEGQRIKNKPQDILNRRKPGQVASGDKEDYKKVVGKKGDVGKAYGNVGPKGQLPENGSFFSNY
jgi:hypothetical protein